MSGSNQAEATSGPDSVLDLAQGDDPGGWELRDTRDPRKCCLRAERVHLSKVPAKVRR